MPEGRLSIDAARAKGVKARRAPLPYTKGWRAPWGKGGWGGFGDGHCRLAKLAKDIERELLADYVATTPQERRALWRAARFQALAEMQLARIDGETKVVVSRSTKPAAVAERILSRLTRRTDAKPLDPARAIQHAQANGDAP